MNKKYYFSVLAASFLLIQGCGTKDTDPTGESVPADTSDVTDTETGPQPQKPAEPSPIDIKVGDVTLTAPTDFQMAVAFFQVVGLSPPFDQWASSDRRATDANEFERPAIAARIQQELLLAARSVAGVGYVEINTSSNFGEYDMNSQGFRLKEIEAGKYYRWDYGGNRYKLTMENANLADLWKIPAEDARKLVESVSYRSVDLKLRIKIIGAVPESGGGGTLQGKIVGYDVLNKDGRKLGGMVYN